MKYITGALLIITSIVMIVFTFMFWHQDEEAVIVLACLYVALVISICIGLIGIMFIVSKDDKDKSE